MCCTGCGSAHPAWAAFQWHTASLPPCTGRSTARLPFWADAPDSDPKPAVETGCSGIPSTLDAAAPASRADGGSRCVAPSAGRFDLGGAVGEFHPARKRTEVSVGESLRILRELQELSQNQLSELTGVSQATISAIENGRVNLGVERAKVLARALKCHPAVLLFPGYARFGGMMRCSSDRGDTRMRSHVSGRS